MADATAIDTQAPRPPRNQWWDVWDQFKTHKGAMAGLIFFIFIVAAVYLGPYLWTLDPTYIDIRARNQGPSLAHPFGADQLGRDILARMLQGGQVSISVGLTAMGLSLVLGTFIGVLAGYWKRLDGLLMRLTDLFCQRLDCDFWLIRAVAVVVEIWISQLVSVGETGANIFEQIASLCLKRLALVLLLLRRVL